MDYITKVTEEHRVSSEDEAAKLIEAAKKDPRFTVLKSSTVYKTIKEKKEIVEEYWLTTLVKQFTDAKEPDCSVSIEYKVDQGAFPDPRTENESEGMF